MPAQTGQHDDIGFDMSFLDIGWIPLPVLCHIIIPNNINTATLAMRVLSGKVG
jgi:hypothetical protein